MCPMYQFEHPDTKEVFEDFRSIKNRNKPYISPDGKKCKRREVPTSIHGWKGNKEVFEADRDYVKKSHPKYVKFKDGHRERYDPTKHC